MLDVISKLSSIVSAIFSWVSYFSGKKVKKTRSKSKINWRIEHAWPAYRFADISKHELEVQLSKAKKRPCSIRRAEWCVKCADGKDKIWPLSLNGTGLGDITKIPNKGIMLHPKVGDVVSADSDILGRNIHKGYKSVKSLRIKISLLGGEPIYCNVSPSLQLVALYQRFGKSAFFNWYQFRLLNT